MDKKKLYETQVLSMTSSLVIEDQAGFESHFAVVDIETNVVFISILQSAKLYYLMYFYIIYVCALV